MNNMKDYMMWLVDRGFATAEDLLNGQRTLGDRDLYGEECMSEYQEDSDWHTAQWSKGHPKTDEDGDLIDDDDEDGFLDDDDLGDIQLKVDTIGSLLDLVFADTDEADHFRRNIDTDMLTRLWGISEDISRLNERDKHGWSPDEYWFNSEGGLTGDAQNYLHELDAKGELI